MLPTHGAVSSVFLLAHVIRYDGQFDVASWTGAARDQVSFLADALDHTPAAELLVNFGLVSSGPVIQPSARLRAISKQSDRRTMLTIAAMLLELDPPPWLQIAVHSGRVHFELIPTADHQALSWLEPDLERLLLDVSEGAFQVTDNIAAGLGRAAELTVLAALNSAGASPIHVAAIADHFGYDIESTGTQAIRWEVKGSTESTVGTLHLTRNEFNKSREHGDKWKLIQVEFSNDVLIADEISSSHVKQLRELTSATLGSIVPDDTPSFSWETSARVDAPVAAWTPSSLQVPANLRLPSITTLGHTVSEARSAVLP